MTPFNTVVQPVPVIDSRASGGLVGSACSCVMKASTTVSVLACENHRICCCCNWRHFQAPSPPVCGDRLLLKKKSALAAAIE